MHTPADTPPEGDGRLQGLAAAGLGALLFAIGMTLVVVLDDAGWISEGFLVPGTLLLVGGLYLAAFGRAAAEARGLRHSVARIAFGVIVLTVIAVAAIAVSMRVKRGPRPEPVEHGETQARIRRGCSESDLLCITERAAGKRPATPPSP